MSNPKAHHLVPQYYLRGFTTRSNANQIWVYEKSGREPYLTNIRNVAVETHFYSVTDATGVMDPSREIELNEEVERPANPIVDKIRARQPITLDEKLVLAEYMSVLLKRGNKTRDRLIRNAPDNADRVWAKVSQEIDEAIAEDPSRTEHFEEMRRQGEMIVEEFKRKPSKQALLAPISTSLAVWLGLMTWKFLTFDKGIPFLTSDSPIIYTESLGLRNADTEVIWPISSTVALWTMKGVSEPDGYLATTEQVVREINRMTVRSAYRSVLSPISAVWIRNMVTSASNRASKPIDWMKLRHRIK